MLNSQRDYYLQQMGVDVWVSRPLSGADSQMKLMVIGDVSEWAEKKILVGKAHNLLQDMLVSIGLTDEAIYFSADMLQGKEALVQKIKAVNPQLLCSVGHVAATALLQQESTLEQMRNQVHHCQNIPLVATYHPMHLLHCPGDKKKAYQDLLTVQALLMKNNR